MIRRQYSLQSIKENSIMRLLYDIIIFSNGRNYDTLEELLNDPERDRNEYCILLSRYNTYIEKYQHNSKDGILCPMKLMKNIRNGAINHSKLRF